MQLIREDYLKLIRPYYDVDLIKVITGVRRSGKSVLMDTIKNELLSNGISGSHIISINLEDLDYSFITTANELHSEIKSLIIDQEKYYIFIDEIQHLEDFEKVLASLKAKFNCSIFVTGSDSTMLSGELATLLTGRTVEFEIFPFSFKESVDFLALNNIECNPDEFINDYIKWGGFPLRFSFREENSVCSKRTDFCTFCILHKKGGTKLCTLYDRIISLCKIKGVTGSRMCLDLGLSKSTMSEMKAGRTKGISTTTAQKIASYFGVTIGYLLGEEEKEKKPVNEDELAENVIIWHRDGKTTRREFTPEQMKMLEQMINAIPEKPKDNL